MYLHNFFTFDIDDKRSSPKTGLLDSCNIWRTLIHRGSESNIGCWQIAVDHSDNAVAQICQMISLKHQGYADICVSWGNIVFDIVAGLESKKLTIGEISYLKNYIYSLSTTGDVDGCVRVRMMEPEDEWYRMSSTIVVSLMFEKQTKKAEQQLVIEWYTTIHESEYIGPSDDMERMVIEIGTTFELYKKDCVLPGEDIEIYSFKIPRYPFTLKLINETVEWIQDPYDGDGVVIRNGKLIHFHSKPGHTIGKGTYRYEQHCLTQIK